MNLAALFPRLSFVGLDPRRDSEPSRAGVAGSVEMRPMSRHAIFTYSSTPGGASRLILTTGVLPTVSRMFANLAMASRLVRMDQ